MEEQKQIEYEKIEIEKVCRICLTKRDKIYLINETNLVDMLLECAGVQVTAENGFFSFICCQCVDEVNRWYLFRQQVIRAFQIGNALLEKKSLTSKSASNSNDFNMTLEVLPNPMPSITDIEDERLTGDENSVCLLPEDKVRKAVFSNVKSKSLIEECAYTYNHRAQSQKTSRLYICSKCNKSFKTSRTLSDHLKRHYNDRHHNCILCGQKFYTKTNLGDHMRLHTGEKPFKCSVCKSMFRTKATLRQHQVVHDLREKKFRCDICNKYLQNAGSLETHKRKHSGIRPFSCSACDKQFFTKDTMQRHFEAIHDTDNNFLCSVCSKTCSTKFHLNSHMKKKHSDLGNPSNAVCLECGKQCGSVAELKVHTRIHSGERPYICHICNKGFIGKGNLNSHIHRHSGNKPFLCNHCGKAFGEKSTLKVHERIHTGEQPFKCNFCGKLYIQASALRTHLKQH